MISAKNIPYQESLHNKIDDEELAELGFSGKHPIATTFALLSLWLITSLTIICKPFSERDTVREPVSLELTDQAFDAKIREIYLIPLEMKGRPRDEVVARLRREVAVYSQQIRNTSISTDIQENYLQALHEITWALEQTLR